MQLDNPPKPYLTREESDERLKRLGFIIHGKDCLFCGYPPRHTEGTLVDTPTGRKMFQALQELIAGAIAEWADLSPELREGEDPTQPGHWDRLEEELNTWAQEWLVG